MRHHLFWLNVGRNKLPCIKEKESQCSRPECPVAQAFMSLLPPHPVTSLGLIGALQLSLIKAHKAQV